ncbi:hypothetical protein HaLaN_33020, partial [Haematococcus lacustris]
MLTQGSWHHQGRWRGVASAAQWLRSLLEALSAHQESAAGQCQQLPLPPDLPSVQRPGQQI